MELFFNHPGLLWGLAAAPLPILLHLINRTRAKKVPFTALRFIEQSLAQQSIKYRLRELILMILRVAMMALLALLLSRPFVRSRYFSFAQKVQSSAVLVLDDTLSMSYREGQKTLGERARDEALKYLDTLTDGSRVSVYPLSEEPGALSGDLERIRKQVAEWAPAGRAGSCGLAKASVKLHPEVSLYILDVGESRDRNGVVQGVSVETPQARVNVPVQIQALVRGGDEPMDRALELVIGGKRVDSKRVKLDKYKVATVTFSYAPEAGGLVHGSVRFAEPDALAMDDERFFTIWVRDAVRAVLTGDGKGDLFLKQALAPDGLSKRAPVIVEPVHPVELENFDLGQTDVVILSNVRSLAASAWQKLREFVRGGGGLLIFAGDEVDPAAYTPTASQGVLTVAVREKRTEPAKTSMEISDPAHAVFAPFSGGMNGDLSMRVFRTWLVLEPAEEASARVLARFRGSSPALVERDLGSGRVLIFASSADPSWNDLPSYGAPYVPLMHLLVRHATGRTASTVTALVGEPVSMPLPRKHGTKAVVRWPGGKAEEYVVEPSQRELPIERAARHGHARVTIDGAAAGGFAVNVDPRESKRERTTTEDVAKGFTAESYVRFATSLAGLERRVENLGGSVDLYPVLIALLFLVFLGEAVYANRV